MEANMSAGRGQDFLVAGLKQRPVAKGSRLEMLARSTEVSVPTTVTENPTSNLIPDFTEGELPTKIPENPGSIVSSFNAENLVEVIRDNESITGLRSRGSEILGDVGNNGERLQGFWWIH
ncbi:hypothetical protein ACOSQ4_028441 [Xanthoceras sorbifolium]